MSVYENFRWAEDLFARRDYRAAAKVLEELIADGEHGHGLADARTLLARSYFHAARLGKAEATTRALLDDDPTDGYAALLLAFTLRRAGRRDEAERAMQLAGALGAAA